MRVWAGLAVTAVLAGCVAPRQAPRPPSPRPSAPAPLPPARPSPPASQDWRDIPLTPGEWSYGAVAGGSAARFGSGGAAVFVARCDLAGRTVTLSREGAAPGQAPLVDITTSSGRQSFGGVAASDRPAVTATLPARDPFLDKMAFSRGRFIVAVTGTARLAIPSWPEFSRVVEDCRG